jgi:hypothetical protein
MLIDQIIEDSQKEDRLKFWWPNQEEGERLMTRFLDELPNAICFDFADVAEAYASHLDRKGFVFNRDAFCILPPYPLTWCETLYQSCKMGCLAKSYYKAQESVRSDALIENMSEQEISSSGVRKLNPSNEVQLVTLRDVYVVGLDYVVRESNSDVLVFPNFVGCIADAQGHPLTHAWINPDFSYMEKFQLQMQILTRIMQEPHIFWFGFSLLACSNISTEERLISPKLQKARARRGKPPLKNYYVLNVSIDRPRRAKNNGVEPKTETIKKRLHMVRGSLADYSEGPGLFGKYKGRFWRPAHVRGSKEAGEIKKDYRVLSPKENNEQ